MSDGLTAPDAARLTEIIRSRGEPLPIEAISRRFFQEEADRQLVAYTPDHSYLVGQRVSWETRRFGRLVGEITSIESVGGQWRLIIDWELRLSPGLARYRESRAGSRLFYLMDPRAQPPDVLEHGDGRDTVAALLSKDLEDNLSASSDFVEWAGLWAPIALLPSISASTLAQACDVATMDDGIAETNEIIALLDLPGPSAPGHGFATIAVNRNMLGLRHWVWGGPREGGRWFPVRRLADAAARSGRPHRFEDLQIVAIPGLADDELPDALAALVVDATLRGLEDADATQKLSHVLSDWERSAGVLALDDHEFSWFPRQAGLALRTGARESSALLISGERLLIPEQAWLREELATARSVSLGRQGGSDEFDLDIEPIDDRSHQQELPAFDLLAAVAARFGDGLSHTPREVLEAVRMRIAGDEAVLARAVAAVLAGYECFSTADDGTTWAYHADMPHRPRPSCQLVSVDRVVRRASQVRQDAVRQDREMRRYRADVIRTGHMVRGHLRRLRKSKMGNPVQLELARRHGIRVPAGFTFVRPHERHG